MSMAKRRAKSNPYRVEMPDGSRIERSYRVEGGKQVPFGNWKWEVYDPDRAPKRKKLSLYTKDKQAATDKARDYIRRRTLGLFDPWGDAPQRTGATVPEAATPYFKAKRRAGGAASTHDKDEHLLGQFAAHLPAGAALSSVTPKHVEAFLNRPSKRGGGPLSNGSKNRNRATLSAFFGWAVKNGMATANPAAEVGPWGREDNRRDHVTPADVEAILRAITAAEVASGVSRQWLRDWIVFGAGSGLRPGEMAGLRWSAVHLGAQAVEVCKHARGKTKNSRRTVHVTGDALAVLRRRQGERTTEADGPVFTGAKGGPISVGYATKRLQAFGEKAGLSKNVVTYGLRHGYGTNLTAASKPVTDVSRMMGTSVGMLEKHYAHFDPRRGAQHVEDVFGAGGADAEAAAKARERFEMAAGFHRDGRLTLAEAAAVAEMDPEDFAEAVRAQAEAQAAETATTGESE